MDPQGGDTSKHESDQDMSESEHSEKNNEVDSDGLESPHSRQSHSRSRSNSGSESEHSEREGGEGDSHSGSSGRATPATPNPNKSRSRSPSLDAVEKSVDLGEADGVGEGNGDDSRSQSPNLQIDDLPKSPENSESENESEVINKDEPKSPSRPISRSSHSETNSEHSPSRSRSRSVTPNIVKKNDSDDENQTDMKETDEKVKAEDIFGDADDISVSGDEEKNRSSSGSPVVRSKRHSRSRSVSHASSRSRSRSNSDASMKSGSRSRSQTPNAESGAQKASGKENETELVQETRIDVEIPRIVTDLGKEINFVKLPNFLSVEMRPFDSETYEDEIDEEETMDEEGRQRIKLKVSNTIRWREHMNNDGQMIKESNARFVRWSDGSLTLHLGNEMFDVYKQKLHGDHNHMFIRQGTGLQGQAVFRTKLTFRPHSTESFTHKKMTMSLADRSQKTSGIKILTQVGKDPTADRMYYLKKEEEKLRQAARSAHKPQPKKKKPIDTRNESGYQHDDGSDDENAVSLNAIKKQYKKGAETASGSSTTATASGSTEQKASAIYSSDDDEDSDIERRRKKTNKPKIRALRDSDSDDMPTENADNKKTSDSENTDSDDSL